MQVTIDIPEPRYGQLAVEAEIMCLSVQELVARKLHLTALSSPVAGKLVRFPLIPSSLPGTVDAVDEDPLDFLDPA